VTRFPVTDLFFRPLFAFFIGELKSRRVIHVGVTRSPTEAWVAQHLREATPYGQAPKYLIGENESKFGCSFARVAATSGIKILKTPYHAKRPNAICERFMRSVRQEGLDHLVIFEEKQLHRVLHASGGYAQPITTASRNCAADRLHSAARFLPRSMPGTRSWLLRSWVDCTMTPTGQPEAKPRGRVSSWWTRSI
jgi:hypothetical protein